MGSHFTPVGAAFYLSGGGTWQSFATGKVVDQSSSAIKKISKEMRGSQNDIVTQIDDDTKQVAAETFDEVLGEILTVVRHLFYPCNRRIMK